LLRRIFGCHAGKLALSSAERPLAERETTFADLSGVEQLVLELVRDFT
jgi:hypothetical protein